MTQDDIGLHTEVDPQIEQGNLENSDGNDNALDLPVTLVGLGHLAVQFWVEQTVLVLEVFLVELGHHLETSIHRVTERSKASVHVHTHVLVLRTLTTENKCLDRVQVGS